MIVVFLIVCSCQQKNRTNVNADININLDMLNEKVILASDLFSRARTIILETKPESIIGTVSEIQVFDGKFYIRDMVGRSLLIFDLNGKFIRKIGSFGRGPGEYIMLLDFTIDTVKREIYVLDNGLTIHKYSVEGEYINSMQINANVQPPFFNHIQYFDGKIYAASTQLRNEKDNLLYVIDPTNGKIINGYFTIADNMGWDISFAATVFLNRLYGKPRFMYTCMNTIITLEDMTSFMTISSKNWIRVDEIEDIKRQEHPFFAAAQSKKIRDIQNYVETKDMIIFCYYIENRKHTAVYWKDKKRLISGNLLRMILYMRMIRFM